MSVYHMVWIKFHDGVSDERISEHLENLRSMPEKIDNIWDVRVGPNFTDRARGFTHGLIVTVGNREALTEYLEHPHHVAIATPLKADAELMAMDFETESYADDDAVDDDDYDGDSDDNLDDADA